MTGEALRVDGRGGDDDLQVRALRQDALEVAEDEVNVQAAFVRLVNDEGRVAAQQLVVLNFGEQNTVGHELDGAVLADLGGESHLVADGFANLLAELFGDAFGHGTRGEAARLGVADEALLPRPSSRHILGIWVVLPEPVSPAMMTTWLSRIAFMMSSRRSLTGSSSG